MRTQGITDTHWIDNPKNRPQKRLYTIAEAGLYLGRTVWSMRELIWKGELPTVRVGRRIHLDINDLDTFIDKHKIRELY